MEIGFVVKTEQAISDKHGTTIADKLLEENYHVKMDDHLAIKDPCFETELGCISAVGSIVKSVLHGSPPMFKRYEHWQPNGIELFRGKPVKGTKLDRAFDIDEEASGFRLDPRSFSYLPLIGRFAINLEPASQSRGKTILHPGELAVFPPSLINYSVAIDPGSVLMRFAFT